jgi:hypothetical protein
MASVRLLVGRTIRNGFYPISAGASGRKGTIEYLEIERSRL